MGKMTLDEIHDLGTNPKLIYIRDQSDHLYYGSS
jgi:hypothetical protein